jgi:hypothetical protein
MYTAPAHQLTQEFAILLGVLVEPLSQLGQRLATMRNLVFLDLGHLGICLTFVLKAGIPSCGSNQFLFDLTKQKAGLPKLVGPRASTILPYHTNQYIHPSSAGLWTAESDLGSSLEDDGFVARAFRVCKCANGLGALVFKPGEKFVELLDAK